MTAAERSAANSPALEPGGLPETGSRRRRARRAVRIDGIVHRADKTQIDVRVIDFTFNGCGIELMEPLEAGEAVSVALLSLGPIPAHVVWRRLNRAGLEFDPVPSDGNAKVDRRDERSEVTAEITAKALGSIHYRVRIFDISTSGCRVETVELPAIGEHMLIKFSGIEVLDAEVCWVQGHYAGLKFRKPIHPAVLEMLLRRLNEDRK